MSQPNIQLPAAAVDALSRGSLIEAIRIVHASGAGLKDAKVMVENYARQQMGQGARAAAPSGSSHVPGTSTGAMTGKIVFPPQASEALARGDVITAIKFLREANPQLDLRTAKDIVDRARSPGAASGNRRTVGTPDAMHRGERVPTVVAGDGEQPVWLLLGVVLAIAGAAWWAFA